MPQHYKTKLWEVEVPDGWSARGSWAGGEVATFYRPDGVGLLRLFAHPSPEDFNGLAKESLNFSGRMSGSISSGTRGQNFYRKWEFVTRQGVIISVDYSCTIEHADLEQLEVDQIMQTLAEV